MKRATVGNGFSPFAHALRGNGLGEPLRQVCYYPWLSCWLIAAYTGADLRGAKNADFAIACTRILPDGDLIGWKKSGDGAIVKLSISAATKRSHAFGRKCRAESAIVLDVFRDGSHSDQAAKSHYDGGKTVYSIGATVHCDKWNEDFTEECAGGIHFFITRAEAEAYSL